MLAYDEYEQLNIDCYQGSLALSMDTLLTYNKEYERQICTD